MVFESGAWMLLLAQKQTCEVAEPELSVRIAAKSMDRAIHARNQRVVISARYLYRYVCTTYVVA
jgi:hypothetical protein